MGHLSSKLINNNYNQSIKKMGKEKTILEFKKEMRKDINLLLSLVG
jgi:hypothetical protein